MPLAPASRTLPEKVAADALPRPPAVVALPAAPLLGQVDYVRALDWLRDVEELVDRLVHDVHRDDIARSEGGLQPGGEAREQPGPRARRGIRGARGAPDVSGRITVGHPRSP